MTDQGADRIGSRGMGGEARRASIRSNKAMDDQLPSPSSEPAPTTTAEEPAQESQSGLPRHISAEAPHPSNSPALRHDGLSRNPSTRSDISVPSERRLEPPVTKATLSELDVNKIIHNPKLRHDINFDPELHFRPNLDGEKGRRKQDKANQFWTTLNSQLQQFVTDPVGFQTRYAHEDWSLPLLLRSVKEIIQTLVPARDRMYLDEGLNVDLIMQQFNRGVADLEKLASWLSGVLKSHCAPMRDEWVDEMYNQLTNGNRTNNMEQLVQGMRSLLSVLEAMKLDVANHQIRCLRPILIEDTVHFEKRFFLKKMQSGKLDASSAQQWYASSKEKYGGEGALSAASRSSFGDMAVFFEALAQLILPSNASDQLPHTFLFDEERILKLRSDMLDAINLEICMRLYEGGPKSKHLGGVPLSFANQLFTFGREDDFAELLSRPSSRPSSSVFSSAGSAESSPRSSLVFAAAPTSSASDAQTKSQSLYGSLVALLQSAPCSSRPNDRWKAMKSSLALQIFRFTDAPSDRLLQFEDELEQHLSNTEDPLFREVEADFHTRFLKELQHRVKELKGLNGVGLFTVATGGRAHAPSRTWEGPRERSAEREVSSASSREAREEGGVEEMATRLAHLGLLHWRVWSQLVYHGEADTDMAMDLRPDLSN